MSNLKILLRGIRTNLFSFCLVFFSTLLVVVVLIVNFSFEQSVISTRVAQVVEMYQNTQIQIGPENTNEDQSDEEKSRFGISQVKTILTNNSNVAAWVERYSFSAETKMKTKRISFYSIDLIQQNEVYQIGLSEGSADFSEENGVIVSQTFAEDNSLKLNDTFTVYLSQEEEAGSEEAEDDGQGLNQQGDATDENAEEKDAGSSVPESFDVVVKGISPNSGIFEQDQSLIISKLAFVQKTLNLEGKINYVDVVLYDLGLVSVTTDELNAELAKLEPKLIALQKFDQDFYDSYVSTVVLALNLFVGFMVLVSVYIILSVFRSYVYQNMREMVTLRSIGFTIKRYRFLVLGQVAVIALVASFAALALSYPCVSWLLAIFVEGQSITELNMPAALLIIACVCGISLFSAWLATIKVTKTPMVDILKKNVVQKKDSHRSFLFCLGLILWSVAVAALIFGNALGVAGYFVAMGLALIGFILLHDLLVYGFSRFIEVLFGKRPRTLGLFAKQLKFNCGSYTQSISIISLVLIVSTLAASISAILDETLSGVYQGSDITVEIYSEEYDQAVTALNNTQGASHVMQKRKFVAIDNKWVEVSGVPIDQYKLKNYERVTSGSREEIFDRLTGKETIIITTTFAKNHNKKVGDSVKVENKDFLVVGVVNSFEKMGSVLFVSERNYKETFTNYDYCLALVDAPDTEAARTFLLEELDKNKVAAYSVDTVEEMYARQEQNNQLIINVIYFLCVFSLLISSISMVSNLIINMISRKLDFLIYRTIGITRGNIRRTVLFEALSMGLYSGITGIALGCILLPVLSIILSYYIGAIGYSMQFAVMGLLVGVACLISVLSVLFTVQRFIFKANLIEEIKRV